MGISVSPTRRERCFKPLRKPWERFCVYTFRTDWMDLSELADVTTAELIEYIQGKEDYPEAAECAFRNFFLRFEGNLTKKCRVVAKNWGFDETHGDVISEQTLEKFWKKPKTFTASKCGHLDLDTCVLLYLFSIAQHLLVDRHRESKRHPEPYTGEEEVVIEFPALDGSKLPSEKRKMIKERHEAIQKALNRLSHKHRIIYLTYKAHEKKGMNLSKPLQKKLREEVDLAQGTVRKYKMEAIATVNQVNEFYGKK